MTGLFIGVNMTFFPMHTLGLDRMPRRYITYAGFMSNYNRFCTYGALVSIVFLFIGLGALNPSMSAHYAYTMLAVTHGASICIWALLGNLNIKEGSVLSANIVTVKAHDADAHAVIEYRIAGGDRPVRQIL